MNCPDCGTEMVSSYGAAKVCDRCGHEWTDGGGGDLILLLIAAALVAWCAMLLGVRIQ